MDDNEAVCSRCVGDAFLRAEIESTSQTATCGYCGEEGAVIQLDELADKVEAVFGKYFERTPNQPSAFESAMLRDPEGTYDWERKGEPVHDIIVTILACEAPLANDVLEMLGERHGDWDSSMLGQECEFDSDSYYKEKGVSDDDLQLDWDAFERELKLENRFFSRAAHDVLNRVFKDLNDHRTWRGAAVVRDAGPDTELTTLYRARTFHDDIRLQQVTLLHDA
jgi:hypothetical protein